MVPRVTTVDTVHDLVAALGPKPAGGRAIALVGGADSMAPEALAELRAFFATLAGYLERTSTAVVDGGTDSGVIRLIGRARTAAEASFRLIGVIPRGALDRRTRTGAAITIEPDHPEILLAPGSKFGDESVWLFRAADHLAQTPAPTLVVNGGKLTSEEAHKRLAAGRRVVVVAGSGRAADELAADRALRTSGRLHVVQLNATKRQLRGALHG
jgi:hypothetical protein